MSRGWTYIDENNLPSEEEQAKNEHYCDELARRWSAMHDEDERRGFQRMAEIEDGEDNDHEFETEEEMRQFKELTAINAQLHAAAMTAIENMLAEKGARMMRPYEHWNEDETLMEYMERER